MSIPAKAYAAFDPHSPLVPWEIARRDPGPHDVQLQILYCGVCHSDLHTVRSEWPGTLYPCVPGHEIVGHVSAVGDAVSGFKVGDTVGVGCLVSSCQQCSACSEGFEQFCEKGMIGTYNGPTPDAPGHTLGGYSQRIVVDQGFVLHVRHPVEQLAAVAPLLCAGITTYSPLRHWNAGPGKKVGVVGIGGLGHMAVQYAKAMGLNVAAVDVDDGKLALATRLGATVTVNALKTDPAAFLKKEIGGAHGALVTAVSPKAFEQALGMVRRGGTVSLNGLPPGDFPLPIFDMVLNGITVRGSIVGTRLDLQESLAFAAMGKVAATVATDRLENINDVFARMHAGTIEGRIVLDFAA